MSAVLTGDVRELAPLLRAQSVDAIITDPPYEIGMFGAAWDKRGVAFDPDVWRAIRRLAKPGAFLQAFGGTKRSHRMVSAIEDAGFEIRDSIPWIYGSGMPKSLDVSKAIDKFLGAERPVVGSKRLTGNALTPTSEKGGTFAVGAPSAPPGEVPITAAATPEAMVWDGWGTNLKPANEPICLARNPFAGTVVQNVLRYGLGGLNIDACRVAVLDEAYARNCAGDRGHADNRARNLDFHMGAGRASKNGRWPPNVLFGHSLGCNESECDEDCPIRALATQSGPTRCGGNKKDTRAGLGGLFNLPGRAFGAAELNKGDRGTAARYFPQFFYAKKAYKKERTMDGRVENTHGTVKPIDLVRRLIRQVVPPGGLVLDPFAGSGTTGIACQLEGVRFIGIELLPEHAKTARARIRLAA
jgi:DNA modification methylase